LSIAFLGIWGGQGSSRPIPSRIIPAYCIQVILIPGLGGVAPWALLCNRMETECDAHRMASLGDTDGQMENPVSPVQMYFN